MKINHNNYEAYLIDYLEGNLSAEQEKALQAFLDQHPELAAELEDMSLYQLKAPNLTFENKDALKKNSDQSSPFDDLCIAWGEKDLDAEQEKELMQRIENNPEDEKTFELYKKLYLHADTSIIYPDKESLKRKSRTIPLSAYISASIAAAAAVLLFIVLPLGQETNTIPEKEVITSEQTTEQKPAQEEPKLIPDQTKEKAVIAEEKSTSGQIPPAEKKTNIAKNQEKEKNSKPDDTPSYQENSLKKLASISPEKIEAGNGHEQIAAIHNRTYHAGQTSEAYYTLGAYAVYTLRKNVLQQNEEVIASRKVSIWDVLNAGVNGISTMTGKDMELTRQINDQGEVNELAFNSENISFRIPVK